MQPLGFANLALKEWSGVIQALIEGRPTLLLRKGGIAEQGFELHRDPFWLFPTWSHQQEQGLREDARRFIPPHPDPGVVFLQGWASVKGAWRVRELPLLDKLYPWNVLKPETVRKRFEYRYPGLMVLALEVFRLPVAKEVVANPAWEGCHSWLKLDTSLELAAGKSCLNSAECNGMVQGVEGILGKSEV